MLLPGRDGEIGGAVLGLGEKRTGDPMDKPELAIGLLPAVLPPGCYHLADEPDDPALAAVAWGLGAYRFGRYKSGTNGAEPVQLKVPKGVEVASAMGRSRRCGSAATSSIRPASDMGPEEIEDAARQLARKHGAECHEHRRR